METTRHPTLYEINTRIWVRELSQALGTGRVIALATGQPATCFSPEFPPVSLLLHELFARRSPYIRAGGLRA